MRSTISPNCATARSSLHDHFPSNRCARQSAALGYPQGTPVPQVQSHVSKRVVWRADLLSLQKTKSLAERCVVAVLCCEQTPIVVCPRVSVQLIQNNPKGPKFPNRVTSG
jgi:hypothetical protein